MSDAALIWDNRLFGADLALAGGSLAVDDGLRTAIIVSLFSDARARISDALPDPGGSRRGWWGDGVGRDEGDEIGSLLWLLSREKRLPLVLTRAREAAANALAWLTQDGVAKSVSVTAEAQALDRLAIGVVVERPEGPGRDRFDFVWDFIAGELV